MMNQLDDYTLTKIFDIIPESIHELVKVSDRFYNLIKRAVQKFTFREILA
jgi:hypothetical protein